MNAQKSNLKNTLAVSMGAITSIASSVGALFETTNKGISMLHRAVDTAAEKQSIGTDYDLAVYETNLHKAVSIEQARQNAEIKAFLTEKPENAQLFESSFNDIGALVAARRQARGV
jgi:hypothetical protein